MVLVTVVMACAMKTRSAILRLFLAIMMLRRPMKVPKPLRSCWLNPAVSEDCTLGLKKLAEEPEEERVLSQATLMVVPGLKLWLYATLKMEAWECKPVRLLAPTPVPDKKGLLTAVVRESSSAAAVMVGS